MKNYSTAAVAIALGISESAMEGKNSMTIADILTLSENQKLKRYDDEAAAIKKLIADIKALET